MGALKTVRLSASCSPCQSASGSLATGNSSERRNHLPFLYKEIDARLLMILTPFLYNHVVGQQSAKFKSRQRLAEKAASGRRLCAPQLWSRVLQPRLGSEAARSASGRLRIWAVDLSRIAYGPEKISSETLCCRTMIARREENAGSIALSVLGFKVDSRGLVALIALIALVAAGQTKAPAGAIASETTADPTYAEVLYELSAHGPITGTASVCNGRLLRWAPLLNLRRWRPRTVGHCSGKEIKSLVKEHGGTKNLEERKRGRFEGLDSFTPQHWICGRLYLRRRSAY